MDVNWSKVDGVFVCWCKEYDATLAVGVGDGRGVTVTSGICVDPMGNVAWSERDDEDVGVITSGVGVIRELVISAVGEAAMTDVTDVSMFLKVALNGTVRMGMSLETVNFCCSLMDDSNGGLLTKVF